jgi:hypothetical protein
MDISPIDETNKIDEYYTANQILINNKCNNNILDEALHFLSKLFLLVIL